MAFVNPLDQLAPLMARFQKLSPCNQGIVGGYVAASFSTLQAALDVAERIQRAEEEKAQASKAAGRLRLVAAPADPRGAMPAKKKAAKPKLVAHG